MSDGFSLTSRGAWQVLGAQRIRSGMPASPLLLMFESELAIDRAGKCDVHWGCHSCGMNRGHWQAFAGDHECGCKQVPYRHSVFYGRDQSEEEKEQRESRLDALFFIERALSKEEENAGTDKMGNPKKRHKKRPKGKKDVSEEIQLPVV